MALASPGEILFLFSAMNRKKILFFSQKFPHYELGETRLFSNNSSAANALPTGIHLWHNACSLTLR
jgi:hypothetical protein